ncbi:MAG TPA: lysophospholipid acyltransferase family protein [Chitinophagaceae bacterium]|nr:lysophospholipid acyltransferase family protein [Chitinophagaceae bacterium]
MLLIRLLSRLPLRVLYVLSDLFYLVLFYIIRYRRKVIWTNLEMAYPEKSPREIRRLASRFYHNLADAVVETIKSITFSQAELCRRVVITDSKLIDSYVREGKSALVVTAHCFNWEWALLRSSLYSPIPVDALYTSLTNPRFDRLFLDLRGRFGCHMIRNEDFALQVLRTKKKQRIIAINADQVPQPRSKQFWTRFLNRDTAFIDMVEKLPRILDYSVFFMKVNRVSRGHFRIAFVPIADPPYPSGTHDILNRYSRMVEEHIGEDPANWLWSHRRWKHPRPAPGVAGDAKIGQKS